MRRGGATTVLLPAAVFGFGIAISLSCGRLAFSPYDQSLVFDGGWRVLCGQVPLRDFIAPLGIVPFVVQAGFFAIFGVSWLVYALHAALLNGLFGLLVIAFLRLRGASRPLAAFFGLLSTVVFTPPFGMPHSEQHAFLFSLAAFVVFERAVRRPRFRRTAWALLPPLAVLALLSKQIPTLPLLAVLALRVAFAPRAARRGVLAPAALSSVAVVALLAAAAAALRIAPAEVRLSLLDLPYQTGSPRLQQLLHDLGALFAGAAPAAAGRFAAPAALAAVGAGAATLLRAVSRWTWPYHSFLLVPVLGAAAALVGPVRRFRPPAWASWGAAALALIALADPAPAFLVPPLALAAAAGVLVASVLGSGALARRTAWAPAAIGSAVATGGVIALFAFWTPLSGAAAETLGYALLFAVPLAALGSSTPLFLDASTFAPLLLAATLFVTRLTNQEPQNGAALVFLCTGLLAAGIERAVRRARRGTGPALAALLLVAGVGVSDAIRFHRDVNLSRKIFLREGFAPETGPRPADFPPALRFAVLQAGRDVSSADIAAFVRFFREHSGAFLLLGRSRYLHALTGRPSVDPALWDHAGLAFPRPGTPAFAGYDRDLLAACRRHRIRWVVVENTPDPAARLAALPWLERLVGTPPGGSVTIGPWRIVDVGRTFQPAR